MWHRDEDLDLGALGKGWVPHQEVAVPLILDEKWLNPGSYQETSV